MFNVDKVMAMVEETICSYFRNVCGWSIGTITDLIADLYTSGKPGAEVQSLMLPLDIVFLETVIASAVLVMTDDEGESFQWATEPDDSMDGDHESALSSAGFGTDEDYGGYDNDNDSYYDSY